MLDQGAVPESTHDGHTEPLEIDPRPSERPTLEVPALSDRDLATTDKLADCRNGHGLLKADEERWSTLKYVGFVAGVDGDAPLELRNCGHCGSTVARELEEEV